MESETKTTGRTERGTKTTGRMESGTKTTGRTERGTRTPGRTERETKTAEGKQTERKHRKQRTISAARRELQERIRQAKAATAHYEAIRDRVAEFGKVRLNMVSDSINYFKVRDATHVPGRGSSHDQLRENAIAAASPLFLAASLMHDIGEAIVRDVGILADAETRTRLKQQYLRQLGVVRRPFYYDRENARRRALAAARRKLHRRRTLNPMPTPADLRAAWKARKESPAAIIRLGGMLQDLECYVDNCLRFDGGEIVGRNGGIKGFLAEKTPELLVHYKTLMRYKAMAVKLRQATATRDPKPTDRLLSESPRHPVVKEILALGDNTFTAVLEVLELRLSPKTALAHHPTPQSSPPRRTTRRFRRAAPTR